MKITPLQNAKIIFFQNSPAVRFQHQRFRKSETKKKLMALEFGVDLFFQPGYTWKAVCGGPGLWHSGWLGWTWSEHLKKVNLLSNQFLSKLGPAFQSGFKSSKLSKSAPNSHQLQSLSLFVLIDHFGQRPGTAPALHLKSTFSTFQTSRRQVHPGKVVKFNTADQSPGARC